MRLALRGGLLERSLARRLVLMSVLAGIAAASGPVSAQAELSWSDSERIGTGYGDVEIDARGNALAVWARETGFAEGAVIEYSWRPAGRSWSAPTVIGARPHVGGFDVAMNPYGRASLLWTDASGKVLAAEAPRALAAFGEPEQLAETAAMQPRLAVDDEGNGVAVWVELVEHRSGEARHFTTTLFRAERRAGSSWGPGEPVAKEILDPEIAMNPSGAAVLAWGAGGTELRASYRPPGGRFGAPESPPVRGFFPEIALSDRGEVIFTGGSTQPEDDVPFALRDPVNGWQPPVGLGAKGWVTRAVAEPSGAASFVLQVVEGDGNWSSAFATRLPTGAIVGPTPLAGPDTYVCPPAMNRRGDLLIPLTRPNRGSPDARVYVTERPSGGVFLPQIPISSPGDGVCSASALNDAGQAVVVGTDSAGRLAARAREDPSLPPLPLPPDVDVELPSAPELDQGGALRVAVRCSTACKVRPDGSVYSAMDDRPKRGAGSSRRLKARRRGRVTLRFDAATAKSVRKALRQGRRPWVSLSVTARGKSPRPVTVSRRVNLKRK